MNSLPAMAVFVTNLIDEGRSAVLAKGGEFVYPEVTTFKWKDGSFRGYRVTWDSPPHHLSFEFEGIESEDVNEEEGSERRREASLTSCADVFYAARSHKKTPSNHECFPVEKQGALVLIEEYHKELAGGSLEDRAPVDSIRAKRA